MAVLAGLHGIGLGVCGLSRPDSFSEIRIWAVLVGAGKDGGEFESWVDLFGLDPNKYKQ